MARPSTGREWTTRHIQELIRARMAAKGITPGGGGQGKYLEALTRTSISPLFLTVGTAACVITPVTGTPLTATWDMKLDIRSYIYPQTGNGWLGFILPFYCRLGSNPGYVLYQLPEGEHSMTMIGSSSTDIVMDFVKVSMNTVGPWIGQPEDKMPRVIDYPQYGITGVGELYGYHVFVKSGKWVEGLQVAALRFTTNNSGKILSSGG